MYLQTLETLHTHMVTFDEIKINAQCKGLQEIWHEDEDMAEVTLLLPAILIKRMMPQRRLSDEF